MDLESGFDLSGEMRGTMNSGDRLAAPPTNDYHSIGNGFVLMYRGRPYFDSLTLIITVFKGIVSCILTI